MCLKALGKTDEAIEIIEKQSEIEGDFSMYNYLHLGVLYIDKKDYKRALQCFEKQYVHNNLAENEYYAALCYKNLKDYKTAQTKLKAALELYEDRKRMFDPYNELFDQIYLVDIERELKSIKELVN